MMSSARLTAVSFVIILVSLLVGCGSVTAPISVTLSPSGAQALDQAQTVAITAMVGGDSKSAGVAWTRRSVV